MISLMLMKGEFSKFLSKETCLGLIVLALLTTYLIFKILLYLNVLKDASPVTRIMYARCVILTHSLMKSKNNVIVNLSMI